MNKTVQIREAVRSFVFDNSKWLKIVGRGIVALACFLIIDFYFGYIQVLSNPIFAILLAIGSAFIPISAGGLVVMVYTFVQLTGLSVQVAITALILMVAFYGISMFYGAKHLFNVNYIPIAFQIQLPYAIPVGSALFGELNEISSVICGGVLSFYLKTIHDNASVFLDKTEDITVIDVVGQKMAVNPMLYVYIVALVIMFIVIHFVKNANIRQPWLIATVAGILSEMVIMLAGYLLTGNIRKVPMLLLGNVIAFLVGLILTYIFRDLDYDRIERVQFEDDDYVYYVTAIPKIGLTKEEKRVTRITDTRSKFHDAGKIVDDKPENDSGDK